MPATPRKPAARTLKPRTIGVLIFDDFQLLDAAGPIGAFEMPMRGMKPPPYEIEVIAPVEGPVRSSSGAVWMAKAMPAKPSYDTVIIAGGWGTRTAMADPKVQAFVHAAMKTARRERATVEPRARRPPTVALARCRKTGGAQAKPTAARPSPPRARRLA